MTSQINIVIADPFNPNQVKHNLWDQALNVLNINIISVKTETGYIVWPDMNT